LSPPGVNSLLRGPALFFVSSALRLAPLADMSNLVPTKLTSPGAFGGQTLQTYVSAYEKAFAESQVESPAVQASGVVSSPLTAAQ
jgi:hypothetical protein